MQPAEFDTHAGFVLALQGLVQAALERCSVAGPFGGGMHPHLQARQCALQLGQGALGRAGQVAVHGDQHHPHERSALPALEVASGGAAFSG